MLAITDGTSQTIMVGEKHVPINHFGEGWLDSSTYNGDNPYTWSRGGGFGVGLAQSIRDTGWKYGSYHTAGCQFAFCDGSVRLLPNSTRPEVLGLYVQRSDGQVIPEY